MPRPSEPTPALAVFLHDGRVSPELEALLAKLSPSWKLNRLEATPKTCSVLKRMRVPALMLYSKEGDETASAIGDVEIAELIKLTTEE